MTWRGRLPFIVVLALTFIFAACSNGDDDQATPTTRRSTTTSDSAATTSTTAEPVPTPDTTGEDFDRIFREMMAFEKYLFEHPDVALLDVTYTPDANIRPKLEAFVKNLVAKGWHYDDEGPVVMEVQVEKRVDPLNVLLRVVTEHGPQKVVDATGKVVDEGDGWAPRREQYLLKRGPDGRWRIQQYENNGPVGG